MIKEDVAETPPADAMAQARATRNPIKKLYFWTLHWADTPYALPALVILSFAESSFFPVPPDVLLIALCFSAPTRWFKYALWCSVASVLGGAFGYGIGAWGMDLIGNRLLAIYDPSRHVWGKIQTWYDTYGFWGVIIAAVTPIPYKVFTIASGSLQFSFTQFMVASAIGRAFRFFLVAWLIRAFGARIKPFLEKHFELATLAFGAVAVLGVLVLKWLK